MHYYATVFIDKDKDPVEAVDALMEEYQHIHGGYSFFDSYKILPHSDVNLPDTVVTGSYVAHREVWTGKTFLQDKEWHRHVQEAYAENSGKLPVVVDYHN